MFLGVSREVGRRVVGRGGSILAKSLCTSRVPIRNVDLRSDTVTQPNAEMMLRILDAMVGGDVMEEDPTVKKLEQMAAEKLGKEAGLYLVSGTMGNLAATAVHCRRGEEVILGTESHVFCYEAAGASGLLGAAFHTVENAPNGTLPLDKVKRAIREGVDVHEARTAAVFVENTQNRCMGSAIDAAYMSDLRRLCNEHGLKLHVDGARLFNASTALGTEASALVADADSATICLSKGLGAPMGSVLVGSEEFIWNARRARKVLGGGWRQAGFMAAAGIVALENNVAALKRDHSNAKALARGLAATKGILLDHKQVQTNIIYFDLESDLDADVFVQELRNRHILMGTYGTHRVRAVTHLQIQDPDIERTLDAVSDTIQFMRS